jgi:adenylate kinase
MDKGELVPDSVTIKMLEQEVVKHESPKGFIFDGFPRTNNQANALSVFFRIYQHRSFSDASIRCS